MLFASFTDNSQLKELVKKHLKDSDPNEVPLSLSKIACNCKKTACSDCGYKVQECSMLVSCSIKTEKTPNCYSPFRNIRNLFALVD